MTRTKQKRNKMREYNSRVRDRVLLWRTKKLTAPQTDESLTDYLNQLRIIMVR